jgi:hypothetical protein
LTAQLFANSDFLRVRYVQVFAICNLLRVRWLGRRAGCVVCVVSTPFLRKFLIRVREEVSQKSMRNDANDASKKLQIQGRAAHAKNRGGE